jgi:apolipoprotein N-acyltransferase
MTPATCPLSLTGHTTGMWITTAVAQIIGLVLRFVVPIGGVIIGTIAIARISRTHEVCHRRRDRGGVALTVLTLLAALMLLELTAASVGIIRLHPR